MGSSSKNKNKKTTQDGEDSKQDQRLFSDDYVQSQPVIAIALSPLAWLSQQVQAVTDTRPAMPRKRQATAASKLLHALALACVGFSVNTAWVQTVRWNGEDPAQKSFLPHPGVDDWKLQRVIPPVLYWGQEALDMGVKVLPGVPEFKPMRPRYTVWGEARFYLVLTLTLAVQLIEAHAIRRVSLDVKRKQFNRLNKQKKVTVDPQAIHVARVKASEVNSHGGGDYVLAGLLIALVYFLELWVFGKSISETELAAFEACLLGFLDVFGAETAWALAERVEGAEDA